MRGGGADSHRGEEVDGRGCVCVHIQTEHGACSGPVRTPASTTRGEDTGRKFSGSRESYLSEEWRKAGSPQEPVKDGVPCPPAYRELRCAVSSGTQAVQPLGSFLAFPNTVPNSHTGRGSSGL